MFRSCIDRFRSFSFALYSCALFICMFYIYVYIYIYIYIYIDVYMHIHHLHIYRGLRVLLLRRRGRPEAVGANPRRRESRTPIDRTRHYYLGSSVERTLQRATTGNATGYNGKCNGLQRELQRATTGNATAALQRARTDTCGFIHGWSATTCACGRPAFGAKRRRRSR